MFEPDEEITLTLSKSDCLVIFELLTRSYDTWRMHNPDDSAASPLVVSAVRHGERRALWHLEGSIERTLPELFAADYSNLVEQSLRYLEAKI
jgi:hypothetical protein